MAKFFLKINHPVFLTYKIAFLTTHHKIIKSLKIIHKEKSTDNFYYKKRNHMHRQSDKKIK